MPISRGFRGRRSDADDAERLPPGQYLTYDFPVLSAGPTPHTPLEEWTFTIAGTARTGARWTWDEFRALPTETSHGRHPLRDEVVEARHGLGGRLRRHAARRLSSTTPPTSLAFCDGGYTTNVPLEDVTDGKAWVAFAYDGEPLDPEHGGPARLLVPHLYFWKSAKWVRGSGSGTRTSRASGRRTATTSTATRGASSGTGATDAGSSRRSPRIVAGDAARADARPRRRRTGPGTSPGSTSTSG